MNRRRVAPELDPAVWPAFDASALSKKQLATFTARRQAIELYAANAALTQIEASTGVARCQVYRLLDHCLAPHEDGRVFGWRALESAALGGELRSDSRDTDIFITPGFAFRVVDLLVTNFHLPKSTLLMLVSAFAGFDLIKALYAHAIRERYRFFSYGDAMLIAGGQDESSHM